MGTPIKGKIYSMAPTPEGEEHPNIMVTDLRKAAQQALEALVLAFGALSDEDEKENAAIKTSIQALRAALAQPEPMLNGLTEAETNASASVMGLTQPKPEPEPIPGATPMSEYAAQSAAVSGRAEALKRAGYTRRPRQLPGEDEQEPVAWQERQEIQPGKFGDWYLIDRKPPTKSSMPVGITYEWQPLYTAPPQRQPLTDEEAKVLWADVYEPEPHIWVIAERFARAIERAHGIGGEHE